MITVMQDLTPEQLAQRKAQKQRLLAQAKLLCEAYKAGQLREMLDKLRIDNGRYVSYSKQSQQNGGTRET